MGKAIEDTLPDFFGDILDGYPGTFITEVEPAPAKAGVQPLYLAQVG